MRTVLRDMVSRRYCPVPVFKMGEEGFSLAFSFYLSSKKADLSVLNSDRSKVLFWILAEANLSILLRRTLWAELVFPAMTGISPSYEPAQGQVGETTMLGGAGYKSHSCSN